jgi:hypothetical protein
MLHSLYNPGMDIRAGIIAAVLLAAAGAFISVRSGVKTIQYARKLTFYRLRQQRTQSGLRMLGLGVFLLLISLMLAFYGEPVAYQYFPPSPTASLTPTITLVPTITLSPTITLTPTVTDTPSVTDTATITPTPFIPPAIEALFESVTTPNPAAVFSPIQFTEDCADFTSFEAATVFQNPIDYICGVFTYDQMMPGAQWTALWLREGEMVDVETKPWDGTTGGYGYTDSDNPIGGWQAGEYEVQIFVGLEWKVVGRFTVEGDPPTPRPSATPSRTITPSPTRTTTPTLTSSPTPTPSPRPSQTSTP